MTELKRIPVKMIRDYIKKDYEKGSECYICKTLDNLELHHLYSVSDLFHTWCKQNNITVEQTQTVDGMNSIRVAFYKDNREPLAPEHCYTLCKAHHLRLHTIYGQTYPNTMAKKVKNWIELKRGQNQDGNA